MKISTLNREQVEAKSDAISHSKSEEQQEFRIENRNNNNNNNSIKMNSINYNEQTPEENNIIKLDQQVMNNGGIEGKLSPVHQMFDGQSIFITGASGFIGRVLLEKLLRTYKGIKRVYILMRTKKNQLPYDRLHKQLLKVPIFDHIRSMKDGEEILNKIVVIPGDIAEPNLGISDEDLKRMLEDKTLSIVVHSAATIKFDEPLKTSITLNLKATKTIINFCKQIKDRLIGLCHVSTAYVNSDIKDRSVIEEKLYPIKDDPMQLIGLADLVDENLLQHLKTQLVDERPNTYTYTKAVSEHLIKQEASDLPISIVRPSIVVAAWKEPLEGWIDNLNGPTGLVLAIGKGLLRTMYCKKDNVADIIPVDIVVNTMISSVYYTAKINNKLPHNEKALPSSLASERGNEKMADNSKTTITTTPFPAPNGINIVHAEENKLEKTELIQPIIHCASGELNPIKWADMENLFFPIARKYPSCQVLRYPYGTFKTNRMHDLVTRIFVHFLPAIMLDIISGLLGKKRQLFSIYQKVHMAVAALTHFCCVEYNFQTKQIHNLELALEDPIDRKELYMNIKDLDWLKFWDSYILGARRFVLKEPDDTLPLARKSFMRAYWIEMCLRAVLVLLVACFVLPLIISSTSYVKQLTTIIVSPILQQH